jgi:hypothetical protein
MKCVIILVVLVNLGYSIDVNLSNFKKQPSISVITDDSKFTGFVTQIQQEGFTVKIGNRDSTFHRTKGDLFC